MVLFHMNKIAEWEENLAILEAYLQPIAQRPVDITDPNWLSKLTSAPHPIDRAGVRVDAEALLAELIDSYPTCEDNDRRAIRLLFDKYKSFSWAATLAVPATTPEHFRSHLILFSIKDQGRDTRDAILNLKDLCELAKSNGVKIEPILKEIAEISSDENKYGMCSTRTLLLAAC